MKQRIYIDTSVVGGYFKLRSPKDLLHYED